YTPHPDVSGVDHLTYWVSDGHGGQDSATIRVRIVPVNDPPTAADVSLATDEDVALPGDLAPYASDADGDTLRFSVAKAPRHGTLTVDTDGTFLYTPDPDYAGSDAFTYRVRDRRRGGRRATAVVTVTVRSVPDAPVALDDAVTTDEDVPVTVDVLANDSDADGDPLTVTAVGTPGHGTATVGADGTITYTPDPNTNGDDAFTYTVTDPTGLSAGATVRVGVVPVNDAPVAGDDGPVVVVAGTEGHGDVTGGDSDVDGDALRWAALDTPDVGVFVLAADGTWTWDVPADAAAGIREITYEVCDPDGACATARLTLDLQRWADLAVTQTVVPTIVPGTGGDAHLEVTNTGPSDSDGFTVTVTLPAGTAVDAGGALDPRCTLRPDGSVLCGVTGTVPVGGTTELILPVTAAADADPGTPAGEAVVAPSGTEPPLDPDPADDTTPFAVTVADPEADVAIVEVAVPDVAPGAGTTVTVTTRSNGPSTGGGWSVDVELPPGLDADPTDPAWPAGCAVDATGVRCEVAGPVVPGDGTTHVLPVVADPAFVGPFGPVTVTVVDQVTLDPDPANDGPVSVTPGQDLSGDADGDGLIDADEFDADDDGVVDDTDGDGTPDWLDRDSDGDGVDDATEAPGGIGVDSDGDGAWDHRDTDSDADGVDDATEAPDGTDRDSDGDGIPDRLDTDSDGDGIPDAVEGTVDTDGDGVPDRLDLDSDGDDVPDATEAPGGLPVDSDGDGAADQRDPDSDGDGIGDAIEAAAGIEIDTDADATPDRLDLDTDDDTIPDAVEGTDDADGDGLGNWRDPDSDGDGIPDAVEVGPDVVVPRDSDGDGIPDWLDPDSDDDGFADSLEVSVGAGSAVSQPDSDGDGIPDWRDPTPIIDVSVKIAGVERPGDGDDLV
ncbi:MAG: tandem-95 repeat protein, partial [Actinomyces sp.]